MPARQDHQHIGEHAVLILHGEQILEEVRPPGLKVEKPLRREEGALNERPCIVDEARPRARHESAQHDLQEEPRDQPAGGGGKPSPRFRRMGRRIPAATPEAQPRPENIGEEYEGERQMRREPVLADLRAVHEAALHHPPAKRALQAAQHEQNGELRHQCALDLLREGKPEERNEEGKADETAEQPVPPFPPIDLLELRQRHPLVERGVLGDLLVEVEFALPVGLAQRRERARHRLPFGDRKPRLGKPGQPADNHHHEDERGHAEQPDGDLAIGFGLMAQMRRGGR